MALRIFNQRITSCSRLYFRFVDPAYQFSFSKRSYRFSDCNVISSCFSKNVFSFSTSVQKPESCADIEVTFIRASGERIKVKGKKGDSLLDVIINNNLDFDAFVQPERFVVQPLLTDSATRHICRATLVLRYILHRACEGTLTCSTCHVILKKVDYDRLPEKPTDEELDMLDLAHGLTDTSRLGCQIILTEDLNELEVEVPATVNDARER